MSAAGKLLGFTASGGVVLGQADDPINPAHYKLAPGVEVISLTERLNFCRGNAVKYIARAGRKGDELEDLKKARWYIDREIARLADARLTEELRARAEDIAEQIEEQRRDTP